jgi:hypothetical protein
MACTRPAAILRQAQDEDGDVWAPTLTAVGVLILLISATIVSWEPLLFIGGAD